MKYLVMSSASGLLIGIAFAYLQCGKEEIRKEERDKINKKTEKILQERKVKREKSVIEFDKAQLEREKKLQGEKDIKKQIDAIMDSWK